MTIGRLIGAVAWLWFNVTMLIVATRATDTDVVVFTVGTSVVLNVIFAAALWNEPWRGR